MNVGAYGLTLSGRLGERPDLLVPSPPGWTPWELSARVVADPAAERDSNGLGEHVGPDSARLTTEPTGFVEIERAAARSTLVWDHEASIDELVHPGLATTAATVAWWQGRLTLHGAGLAHDGRAIGILGQREHGKSSTAAWLLQRGWDAVSDDLLVLDGTHVLAGPRIVDLRRETAERWDLGEYIGQVGSRERWRFATGPVPPRLPLAALVELEWGSELDVSRIPVGERVGALFAHRPLDLPLTDPSSLLTAMRIPLFRLTRPRDLAGLDRSLALLLDAVGMGG